MAVELPVTSAECKVLKVGGMTPHKKAVSSMTRRPAYLYLLFCSGELYLLNYKISLWYQISINF